MLMLCTVVVCNHWVWLWGVCVVVVESLTFDPTFHLELPPAPTDEDIVYAEKWRYVIQLR